jgi:FkbM family methyltransferase
MKKSFKSGDSGVQSCCNALGIPRWKSRYPQMLTKRLLHLARATPWLGRWILRSIPDIRWQVAVPEIGKFAIALRRNRSYWLRPPLTHEGVPLAALERLIQPGDVVYDLGANIGLYTRFIAQCFKASRIYAFEPVMENRRLFTRNVEIGGCSHLVRLMPFAVGDQDGKAEFQIDDMSSASGTLDAVTSGESCQGRKQYGLPPLKETIDVCKLDTIVHSSDLQPPDVIKIDIEGAEAMAVRGAKETLLKYRPRLIIELHGPQVAREVLQELWGVGYRCFGRLETENGQVYKEILSEDLACINDLYSLHFMLAAPSPELLTTPIGDWTERHRLRKDG